MFFVEQKVSRGKLSFFAYVISGERSANLPKHLRNDDPAKNENWPKIRYTPFLHEIEALNRADVNLFHRDTGSKPVFFYLFLYLFQKPKHLFKENMQSKLLKVIV